MMAHAASRGDEDHPGRAEAGELLAVSGKRLPADFLALAAQVLERLGVRPERGYLL
jgi:hypothetical protein